jgi:hypothetical protein
MAFQKYGKLSVILFVAVGLILTVSTLAALSANQNIPLNGTISAVNLGVYTNSGCTINCTSLNVGTLSPGNTATQTVYVKNIGNVPETLTMVVSNWNPANANTYLTLTWDQQNTVLNAGQSVQATLTLTAAANCGSLTTFSCSVTMTGTQ